MWPRWRSSFNEEWLRKKEYLVRSLFEEFQYQVLSPVPEAEESVSGSSLESTSSVLDVWKRPGGSENDVDSRPYSPLPPLIIERIPNYHDESDEFYRKLEAKMKKLYHKLFVEAKSDSSSMSEDDSQNISNDISFERLRQEESQQSLRRSTTIIEHHENLNTQSENNNIDSENIEESNTEDTSITYTQPLKDKETKDTKTSNNGFKNSTNLNENTDNDTVSLEESDSTSLTYTQPTEKGNEENKTCTSTNSSDNTNTNNQESHSIEDDTSLTYTQPVEKDNEANSKTNDSSNTENGTSESNGSFKIMEVHADVHRDADIDNITLINNTRSTNGSAEPDIQNNNIRNDSEADFSEEENIDSPNNSSTNESPSSEKSYDEIETMRQANILQARDSIINVPRHCSSSIDKDLNEFEYEISELDLELSDVENYASDFNLGLQTSTPNSRKRRRSFCVNRSPLTPVKRQNISIQVDGKDCSNFLNNFFVGSPKVFKLCSCHDHVCD